MLMEDEQIRGFIIKKLFQHGYWGGRHTSIDNLPKGLPSHFKGDAKKVVKSLIKSGIILAKPTSYGTQVSLNPRKKEEIMRYI